MRAIWLGPITALTFLGLSPLAVLPAQAQTHHAASKAAPKGIFQ
jgi:hypothetical protein